MADFNDVVNQLKENNEAEKARDSNLNRNVANLRESNKELLSPFFNSSNDSIKPSARRTFAMLRVTFVEGI